MSPASGTAESSTLLWLLAIAMAILAAYVSLGWVRYSSRHPGLRAQWRGLLLAAVVLGTGLCAAVTMSLAGEALSFAIGYRALWAAALWPVAVLGCLLPMAWLASSGGERWWVLVLCGAWLAALAVVVEMGWITAAGFRPGIAWRPEFVAAGSILTIVGCAAAVWASFSPVSQDSERRTQWRVGGAVLLGLAVMAGREVLTLGIGLPAQVGSVYLHELPGSVLTLVCGVLLPLLLTLMAIDLHLRVSESKRARSRSRHSANFNPKQRRRRKHRVRGL